MTEIGKLDAELEFCVLDKEVDARKKNAVIGCSKLAATDLADHEKRLAMIKELFGSVGKDVNILSGFHCDNGRNIYVGEDFLANYNVTILDIAPVHIGDYCMIGPNTLITTVGHPLSPKGRREKKAYGKPIKIGDDVWIGGNCTILPSVTIGNNVVIAAGAVVTRDVPDNCVVGGVPAKIIKEIKNDIEE